APTPAREKGLRPYGALTRIIRWRNKIVENKANRTATTHAGPPPARPPPQKWEIMGFFPESPCRWLSFAHFSFATERKV
ncbi:MAG: hypothetical protein SOX38_13750, partial [Candidatus Limiplasma sp.]|nr:hypothetical protein [Candidatus Limiplasma sp.]